MGYRRALLARWSRRDRLAVLVVALAVAFLVGTTLVVLAAGAQTAAVAADFGSTGQVALYDSPSAARAAAGADDLVLPFAAVTTPDGRRTVVLARPPDGGFAAALGLRGDGVTVGDRDDATTVVFAGRAGSASVEATPRSGAAVVPPTWYLAPDETVSRLGPTGALVVSPTNGATEAGAPLQAALAFFLRGTREVLAALAVAGLGAAVLVGVTVFAVTRMGVRDRLETIRVVRATGGTPRRVLALFAAQAGLLTAAGVALGYALGVVLPNAAVSVAIATGQPVSLPLAVTPTAATALVPVLVCPVLVGVLAGAVAAYPAATRPPGWIDADRTPRPATAGRPSRLRPRLLDRRLVVPTAATLAAFVVFATVAAGLGAALGPVAATDTATVVEPLAPHPLASQVPEAYADALVAAGIDASGEILLLEVVDGRPFVAVGADFDRFGAVHGAALVEGRAPTDPDEAAVGTALAAALGVAVGDRLVLGGSTRERLTVVRVVGRFDAPGATGGQLVVPLATARHLSGVRPGAVHLVSADRLPARGEPAGSAVGVVDVSVPDRVPADAPVAVAVTLRNEGLEAGPHTVQVRYRGAVYDRTVEVGPVETRTVTLELPAGPPGTARLRLDGVERELRVVEADAIAIAGLPAAAPPDGRPQVRVTTLAGDPVPDATVSVGGRTWRTDDDGRTRVAFAATGPVEVVATAGDRSATRTVDVAAGTDRRLDASLAVEPSNPTVLVQPTARVTLRNPWAVPVDRDLALVGERSRYAEPVTVAPGRSLTLEHPLDRRAPGDYRLGLRLDGTTVAEARYTVAGDDRLAAALASSGRTGQSGLSRSIEAALGNLRLVVAVVVGLAALMTAGATTATFAAGVQARRRTLGVYRATGAGTARVLGLVLRDALVLGAASTAVGLGLGLAAVAAFAELGVLTVLGVSIPPVPTGPTLVAIVAAALGLTLLGAGLATWGVLRTTPGALLAGRSTATERTEGGRE